MVSGNFMSQVTSAEKTESCRAPGRRVIVLTAIEVTFLFSAILAYIWLWHHTLPYLWLPLFAFILVTHVLHHDTIRKLGLGATGFRESAKWVLPLTIILCLPLLAYGFDRHRLRLLHVTWQSLLPALGYGCWCAFQQYLTQSYFNNRLMQIIRNRHLSSALIGIMFSATHIPNLILMVATLIAGVVFAEVFARRRNIWALALAQAVGGLLIAAVAPESMIHHMRVGPGYFFYGIQRYGRRH